MNLVQPKPPSNKRSFWNSCPRQLNFHPEVLCLDGKTSSESAKGVGCPWYIKSELDNFCFWTWMRRVSNAEGTMDQLSQQQVGELLGCSNSKVHAGFKEALENLQKFPEFQEFAEAFKD